MWWGKELVTLYNDAYAVILGKKHPAALGAPAYGVWPEIWRIIGPMLNGVMERGEATWSDNLLLELERGGYPEELYFTFSYSPTARRIGRTRRRFHVRYRRLRGSSDRWGTPKQDTAGSWLKQRALLMRRVRKKCAG